jgi:hypothetical protein
LKVKWLEHFFTVKQFSDLTSNILEGLKAGDYYSSNILTIMAEKRSEKSDF